MPRLFEKNVTEACRQAMVDLKDHVAQVWNQTTRTHGSDSIEAAHEGLILASIHCVIGEHKRADPLIRNYIYMAEEKYGSHSDEVLCSLILLSNNCIGWGRLEDSRCVLERVKFVRQRCSSSRDSILEGLYDFAERYHSSEDPTNKQRGFILFLLALSWCVRYPSDHNYHPIPEVKVAGLHKIYARHVPQLKAVFESYGFVGDRWEWLIRHCNNNLNDLVGLISIFLDKQIFPVEGRPSLKPEMREEALGALVREFHVDKVAELKEDGTPMDLKFVCPLCGSQDLRTKFPEPLYQISTLDKIEIETGNLEDSYIVEREPSEYRGVGGTDEWGFWCDKCGLMPYLEQNYEDEPQQESLARWLLDNCPQDEDRPGTENN